LSYRDLEELLAERGVEVDHLPLYRWVQRFTPLLIDAARPARHVAGERWFVDLLTGTHLQELRQITGWRAGS
jgi:transposase, IS6 family